MAWPDVNANGPDDLLEKLDEVLYQSKQAGRDRLTMVPGLPLSVAR